MTSLANSYPLPAQEDLMGINDGLNPTKDGNYIAFYDCIEIGEKVPDSGGDLYKGRWVIENDEKHKNQVNEERDDSKNKCYGTVLGSKDIGDVVEKATECEIYDVESEALHEIWKRVLNTCLDKLAQIRNVFNHFSTPDSTLAEVVGALRKKTPNIDENISVDILRGSENEKDFFNGDDQCIVSNEFHIRGHEIDRSEDGQTEVENGVDCNMEDIEENENDIMYNDQVFFDPLIFEQPPYERDWDYDRGLRLNPSDQNNGTDLITYHSRNSEHDNSTTDEQECGDGVRQCFTSHTVPRRRTRFSLQGVWKDVYDTDTNQTDIAKYEDINNNKDGMTAREEEELLRPIFANKSLAERIQNLKATRRKMNVMVNLLLTWNLAQLFFLVFTFFYAFSCVCSFKKTFKCSTQCGPKDKKPKKCPKPKTWAR